MARNRPTKKTRASGAESGQGVKLRRALEKQARGERLTRAEASRVRRFEAERRAELQREAFSRVQQRDLVELLSTSRRTILDWERAGMPVHQRGRYKFYSLREVLRWLRERWQVDTKRDGLTKTQAQIELLAERRANLRIRNAVLAGQYIPAAEAEADHRKKVAAVEAGGTQLVKTLARAVKGMPRADSLADYENVIRGHVDALLWQFAGEMDDA